jgi:hypothetical protein
MEIINNNTDNNMEFINTSNHVDNNIDDIIDNTIGKEDTIEPIISASCDDDTSLINDNINEDIVTKPRKTISIESTDNNTLFPALDDFASIYNKYPHCIVSLYQILRDLYIKQEVVNVSVLDGIQWGRNEYFIEGKAVETQIRRILVPCHLDSEIDLQWIQNIVIESANDNKELYLCVHTPESIMYV